MAYTDDVLNKYANPAIDYAKESTIGRSVLNAKHKGEQDDFLSRYKAAIGGQESYSDLWKRIGIELNLPNLQQSANTLNTTVANIPQTYGSATRGFDVNANQLARTIGQKTSELTPAVTQANNALNSANAVGEQKMGYEIAGQEKALLPFQTEKEMLVERIAREDSGYSTDHQAELNALIAKMNAGVTLSEGEATRANYLAGLERTFEYNKQLKAMDIESAKYTADKQFAFNKNNVDPLGLLG